MVAWLTDRVVAIQRWFTSGRHIAEGQDGPLEYTSVLILVFVMIAILAVVALKLY